MPQPEGLGSLFNIALAIAPLDLQTARTGLRVNVKHCSRVGILIIKGVGTDGDDQTFTLVEYTASTGGSSANAAIIDHYYEQEEISLDGDESWVKVTQTPAATVAPGDPSAQSQAMYYIPIDTDKMSDGYAWLGLDSDGAGSAAQLGCAIFLLEYPTYPGAPANLPQAL